MDPTRINMGIDPIAERFVGVAYHGDTPFDIPWISHITDNLYVGGCRDGLALPEVIEFVVSLYPWEQYIYHPGVKQARAFRLFDSDEVAEGAVRSAAKVVSEFLDRGPTLVHCQAGLNRSNLVAGTALILRGMAPEDAVNLLRARRANPDGTSAVLCNKTFESFLLALPKVEPLIERSQS